MKCVLEKPPSKHKSIRLVPRCSRGTEQFERMRRQNKQWVGKLFPFSETRFTDKNGSARPHKYQPPPHTVRYNPPSYIEQSFTDR